jgi:hypothetical protein
MQANISKLALLTASAVLMAATSILPAAAATKHGRSPVRHHALTVHRAPVIAAPAPDPFHGPAAIFTAPVAVAGIIVGLPFQAVNVVFPASANDPRVVVGAPVYVAGRIAQFPFYAVDAAFGVPPTYY